MIALSHHDMQSLLNKGVTLYGSPYSCWELLCHLDEPEKFNKQKAELLKFQYIEILNNPQTTIERSLSIVTDNIIADEELIKACLGALQSSSTLKEFYSSYILDSEGNHREISDVSNRVKSKLNELEIDYVNFISKLVKHLKTIQDLNDSQTHPNLIYSLLAGEFEKLKQRQASSPILIQEVARNIWVYYGYIFYRAVHYVQGGGSIDNNDYEDSNICKHLKTDSPFQFVTGDKGTIESLNHLVSVTQNVDSSLFKLSLVTHDVSHLKQIAKQNN
jgi:hypothetical protein